MPNAEYAFIQVRNDAQQMYLAANEQRYQNCLCSTKEQMRHYYAEKTVSCESMPDNPDGVS